MAAPRRRLIALLFFFCAMSLLSRLPANPGEISRFYLLNQSPLPTYIPPPRADEDRFYWSDVPLNYPITSMIRLPRGRPKRLPKVQYNFPPESGVESRIRQERLTAVKRTFDRCWKSYRARAWGKDELAPISGTGTKAFGGWGATLVDTLDTLWIMEMREDFENAVAAVAGIDFAETTESEINIFETTIRYLGGLLSAFDLSGNITLLDKAVELGDMLYLSFDTPNHMPLTRWDVQTGKRGGEQPAAQGALIAEVGSLSMEFTRLSQLTGNERYFDAVQRVSDVLHEQQGLSKLPGMWPVHVNARDKVFYKNGAFTLGGMADSLYEYFPKMFAMLGGRFPIYEKMYKSSMETALSHLLFRPMTPNNSDILFSGNAHMDGIGHEQFDPNCQHLACFAGGMFALGGRLFSIPEHVSIGRKLTDGCVWAYQSLPLGIMPEIFHLIPCLNPSNTTTTANCTLTSLKWHNEVIKHNTDNTGSNSRPVQEIIEQKHLPSGFTHIDDPRYILWPEAIESVFILYRITGDRRLMDHAWEMYRAIERFTATEFGNAGLKDVTSSPLDGTSWMSSPPQKIDRMESFWMAETLKYLYLLFSEPSLISLDDWVFNTEAHPFRRPR